MPNLTIRSAENSAQAQNGATIQETVKKNWNERKVTVLGAGAATAGLAGTAATLALLTGPLGAIIGVSVAAICAFGALCASLLVKEQKLAVPVQVTPQAKAALTVPKDAKAKSQAPVAQPVPVQAKAEKAPSAAPQQRAETTAATQPTEETLGQKVTHLFKSAGQYVQNNPYTVLGAAAAAGLAAAGYATYGAKAANTGPLILTPLSNKPHTVYGLPMRYSPVFGPENRPIYYGPENYPAPNYGGIGNINQIKEALSEIGNKIQTGVNNIGKTRTARALGNAGQFIGKTASQGYNFIGQIVPQGYNIANDGLKTVGSTVVNKANEYVVQPTLNYLGDELNTISGSNKTASVIRNTLTDNFIVNNLADNRVVNFVKDQPAGTLLMLYSARRATTFATNIFINFIYRILGMVFFNGL